MSNEPNHLNALIASVNERQCSAYTKIAGSYEYGDFTLIIDFIPDDPLRNPSRLRARIPLELAGFPKDVFSTKSREVAARDFLTRSFGVQASRYSLKIPGGKGGRIAIDRPVQEMLETSAVVVGNGFLEARFTAELPVERSKVSGSRAIELFMNRIPKVVRTSLFYKTCDGDKLADWLETGEDADALRSMLGERGLVAFIADGSYLPGRGSGKSENSRDGITFSTPEELSVTFDLPNRGTVRGMGIPSGITLIAGGGSNGKSTFLKALALGVYNHIPGDGRELIITVPDAMWIGTEKGRRIERVDISPFVANGAGGVNTVKFSTEYASELDSQAANIIEALEIGTSLLLIDEDVCAANLMIRDARMQALIPKDEESVTPLVDIIPVLRDELKVSTVIAVSGYGDYFDCADSVIAIKRFKPSVVTAEAKRIAQEHPDARTSEISGNFPRPENRCPVMHSLESLKIKQGEKMRPRGIGYVQYGDEFINLEGIIQLVSHSQARGISRGIALVYRLMDGSKSLREAVEKVINRMETVGLDTLSNRCMGDLAVFRAQELAAAVNRLKNLKIK